MDLVETGDEQTGFNLGGKHVQPSIWLNEQDTEWQWASLSLRKPTLASCASQISDSKGFYLPFLLSVYFSRLLQYSHVVHIGCHDPKSNFGRGNQSEWL